MANKVFKERLDSVGIHGNKYWYTKEYSTDDPGLFLSNCTTYVMGRSAELCGHSVKKGYCDNPMLKRSGYGDAKAFYADANWKTGSTPKLGAICVWGSPTAKYGHVAVVERINSDGSVLVSQSNYHKAFFEIKTYYNEVGVVTPGVGYPFIGYIYNPEIEDIRVERDPKKDQVEILEGIQLRARVSANGDIYAGQYMPVGIYNILKIKERDGLQWVKVATDLYFAINDKNGWTKTYPGFNPEEELEETKEELEIYKNRVIELESVLAEAKKLIESLNELL